jgi:glycolate oxidase iron-sulfur subunit
MADISSAPVSRADLDRCVACGLCLPVCPTYQVTKNENASPRGRLALIRGLLKNELPPSPEIAHHLSLCLQCRRCEAACPAGVEYGRLIDAANQKLEQAGETSKTRSVRLLRWLAKTSTRNRRLLGRTVRLARQFGLIGLGHLGGLYRAFGIGTAMDELPRNISTFSPKEFSPAIGTRQGEVALFAGCINSMFDGDTLRATINVLNKLGFDVHVPATQQCCGALFQHDGDSASAKELAARNLEAFSGSDMPIINVASGCGAHLSEYADSNFANRVTDISAFLDSIDWPADCRLAKLPGKALVQDPCSLRNVLRQEKTVYRLLGRIPGLMVQALPNNDVCCGGAGSYPLREPVMASTLRSPKIESIRTENADYIVSANIGCALHIAAGLRGKKKEPEIVHPIVLIDRQLET